MIQMAQCVTLCSPFEPKKDLSPINLISIFPQKSPKLSLQNSFKLDQLKFMNIVLLYFSLSLDQLKWSLIFFLCCYRKDAMALVNG